MEIKPTGGNKNNKLILLRKKIAQWNRIFVLLL